MIKRDELKGPSCLTNAADDEPLFVLRANDELAPAIVVSWANRYLAAKGGLGKMSPAQFEKWCEAHALAESMLQWKLQHDIVKSDAQPTPLGVKGPP